MSLQENTRYSLANGAEEKPGTCKTRPTCTAWLGNI